MKLATVVKLTVVLGSVGFLNSIDVAVAGRNERGEFGEVHLCKVFGRGYLQLPGSDTCLKISGIVRGQLDINLHNATIKEESKSVLSLSFGSDTSLGKLTGAFSFEAAGNPARMRLAPQFSQGIIGLNRFKIGFTASNWVRYNWGGYNISSGPFGYHKADMLAFEDTIEGVKFRLAAEYPEGLSLNKPSMIAHVSKSWKWGGLFTSGVFGLEEGLRTRAIKSGIEFKLNRIRKGFRLKLQTTFGIDEIGKYQEGERWDFIAALSLPITKKLVTNFTFGTSDKLLENYSVAGNLVWRPVPKFKIISELSYVQGGTVGGLIRVQRTF